MAALKLDEWRPRALGWSMVGDDEQLEEQEDLMSEEARIPVGICGKAGVGKDTFKSMLVGMRPDVYYEYSMAEPIKKIGREVFGFTRAQLHDPEEKERIDGYWGISPRVFLQLVGTDMFRKQFRDDVWIKLAEIRMSVTLDMHMIVSDVRFDNEAAMVKDRNGVLIRVERPNNPLDLGDAAHHVSESGVDDKYVDAVVVNDGSIEDLRRKAWTISQKIFAKQSELMEAS